jgi:signal transduction histidine kinase
MSDMGATGTAWRRDDAQVDMPVDAGQPQPSARRRQAAVAALAVAVALAGVAGAAQRGISPMALVPLVPTGLLFVVAGIISWSRRPDSSVGRLLVATGFAWSLAQVLLLVPHAAVSTLGLALLPLGLAFMAHVALVFPSGRLSSRSERILVVVPYVLAVAGVPVTDPGDCRECLPNPIGVDITLGFGRLYYLGLLLAVLPTALCFLVVLVRRWRTSSVAARRILLPVIPGACLFILVYAVALLSELGVPTGLGQEWALVALLLIPAAPVVLLGGLLRTRLARTRVGDLVVELGETSPRGPLRATLARVLGDPSVEVGYWRAEGSDYVDGDGRPLLLPTDDRTRAVKLIERSGQPVGALVHDVALSDDPAHVDAVCAAAGLALENARLHAEVLARLIEVKASRARIVEAGDVARRRVERNLHDGAQQRLVTLTLAIGMARSRLDPHADPDADVLLRQAAEEAEAAVRELRELARGLHPSILSEVGLVAAVDSLVERSSVPVEVCSSVHGRLPPPVEAAAYYVVAEALTNVAKYARASAVAIRIDKDGDRLRIEVADDGIGGAAIHPGSGLEGLVDRLAALDGHLEIESSVGSGTRLRAELSCG